MLKDILREYATGMMLGLLILLRRQKKKGYERSLEVKDKMNKNAIWLAIFVAMLGVGIVGSCITIPGTHWITDTTIKYEKVVVFGPDGEEIGYAMIPIGEETTGQWIPSFWYAIMGDISVGLVVLGGFGAVYNIARLHGWEFDGV